MLQSALHDKGVDFSEEIADILEECTPSFENVSTPMFQHQQSNDSVLYRSLVSW